MKYQWKYNYKESHEEQVQKNSQFIKNNGKVSYDQEFFSVENGSLEWEELDGTYRRARFGVNKREYKACTKMGRTTWHV